MTGIYIIGTNHVRAPLSVRERYAFDEEARSKIILNLSEFLEEVVLLCTCNRTEIIYNVGNNDQHLAVRSTMRSLGDLTSSEFERYIYRYKQEDALHHLFRVASGLDSMVLGETQILGQLKEAFKYSLDRNLIKPGFYRIYQQMLRTAKTVRSQTALGQGAASVASVAVQLARNIFESLDDKRVLLVGAGEMCEAAGSHFHELGAENVVVINRTLERALEVAEKFSWQAFDLDELERMVSKADIILCSITGRGDMINAKMIEPSMRARNGRPLFIIDIAVPRNVDRRVNDIPDVYLYNIDDLQQLVDRNVENRKQAAAKGEQMVNEFVSKFSKQNGEIVGPLIQSLHNRVSLIKSRELERLFRKSGDITDVQKEQIEQTVNQIVNKILHDPIIQLRRELDSNPSSPRNIVDLFKDFFNL